VAPHSLIISGIQLDVQAFLEDESESHAPGDATDATAVGAEADSDAGDPHHRKHA